MLGEEMWPGIGGVEDAGAGVPLGPDIVLLGLCTVGDMVKGGECGPGDHTFRIDMAFAANCCVTEGIW